MKVLDYIFPKKCINCRKLGDYLCANCIAQITFNDNFQCPICLRSSTGGIAHLSCRKGGKIDAVMTIAIYNKVVKKLINQFKNPPHLQKLSEIIGKIMIEELIQNEVFYKFVEENNPVVVPLPILNRELGMRGYNQNELIANYVAQYFKLKINTNILTCEKEENHQDKSKTIHKYSVNYFKIKKNAKIPKFVILVEDAVVEFKTISDAARIIKLSGSDAAIGIAFTRVRA